MRSGEVEPLLVNRRKFDFRAFLLIGRTAPTVALYHPGFLRIAARDYEPRSTVHGPSRCCPGRLS